MTWREMSGRPWVSAAAARVGVAAYSEAGGGGELRYVQLAACATHATGSADKDPFASVQVALVWNDDGDCGGGGDWVDGDGASSELRVPARARALADEIWRAGGGAAGGGADTANGNRDSGSGGGGGGGGAAPPQLIHSVW